LYCKYRNKFGQLRIRNRIEYVIFYLFLVKISKTLQFWRSTRPMTSFCIFIAYMNAGNSFQRQHYNMRLKQRSLNTVVSNVFTFLTEVGNAGCIVNTGTSSVNSEFVTALNTWYFICFWSPTSAKKVNTSFKNVCRTWGPALPTLLADLMIFCPLGPMNFKCIYF
jgi:hypothetical protein